MTTGGQGQRSQHGQPVNGGAAPVMDGAALFGRNSFDALWTPGVLGGGDFNLGREIVEFVVIDNDETGVLVSEHATGGMQWCAFH